MVLRFYGSQPPNIVHNLRVGGVCPYCKTSTRLTLSTSPQQRVLQSDKVQAFIASYVCDHCLEPIPIRWQIVEWFDGGPVVNDPSVVLPSKEPFEFNYVPPSVKQEIEEALGCLSVNSFNGFAAVCRRAIQAICVNIGAGASSKVQHQIEEMIEITGLDEEWKDLATQLMLSGHDGSHPHLPHVDHERARILLSMLRDLCYQLYTRRGIVREAAQLRKAAIESKRTKSS